MMNKAYENYYLSQAGSGLPYYSGARYQRGHGLGSILGSLFRIAAPLAKGVAKKMVPIAKAIVPAVKPFARGVAAELGKESVGLFSDALKGRKIRTAAKRRVSRVRQSLAKRLDRQVGRGRRSGRRIKRIRTVKTIKTLTGRRGSNIFAR